jgi:hypothetical protein
MPGVSPPDGSMRVTRFFTTTSIESFRASLLIKLEKLDWGSILDNKSDG